MADIITATFAYKENGEDKTLTDTCSVKKYLDSMEAGKYNDEAQTLVTKIRAYGHFIRSKISRSKISRSRRIRNRPWCFPS